MKAEILTTRTNTNHETTLSHQPPGPSGGHSTSRLRRFSDVCLDKLSELKQRVCRELAAEYGTSLNGRLIRQAVQEADSLAWTTPFPSLFLPALAEEKVRTVYAYSIRQERIHERPWMLAA